MIVFKCNEKLSIEEYGRWQNFVTEHWKSGEPIVLPEYFDFYEFEEGEEVEIEEE